jgi:RNA-directed DNA polymerase
VCGKQQGGTSGLKFTALLHHVSVLLLEYSFYALKRDAAPEVDGVTWKEYETGLRERLLDLHSCVHQGTFRWQPSKRAYIPKEDGRQRPLGIAALEDKIVQHAVVTVLNQIYEEDFEYRIAGRRILRLIRKWLRAGVSEEGQWSKTEKGTPQGAVATPLRKR